MEKLWVDLEGSRSVCMCFDRWKNECDAMRKFQIEEPNYVFRDISNIVRGIVRSCVINCRLCISTRAKREPRSEIQGPVSLNLAVELVSLTI